MRIQVEGIQEQVVVEADGARMIVHDHHRGRGSVEEEAFRLGALALVHVDHFALRGLPRDGHIGAGHAARCDRIVHAGLHQYDVLVELRRWRARARIGHGHCEECRGEENGRLAHCIERFFKWAELPKCLYSSIHE